MQPTDSPPHSLPHTHARTHTLHVHPSFTPHSALPPPPLAAPPWTSPSTRSPGRIRKVSQAFRVISDEARQSVHNARLDTLEADNFREAAEEDAADDDAYEDEDEGKGGGAKRKRAKGGAKKGSASSSASSSSSSSSSAAASSSSSSASAASSSSAAAAKRAKAAPGRKRRNLSQILIQYAHTTNVANYLAAGVGAPTYPAAKFCSICSKHSSYTCTRTGAFLCGKVKGCEDEGAGAKNVPSGCCALWRTVFSIHDGTKTGLCLSLSLSVSLLQQGLL